MSHQYDYQCETQSQEECDEQRHYEYEEMLKLMKKQTEKLFNVIDTVKTLDELKQYDVDGVDFKARDRYGNTIAHCYAWNGNATLEVFKYLFEKGVDFEAKDRWRNTIAHYYAKNPNATLEGFKYLFEKEVDFQAVTECGDTIAHYYAYNKNATLEGFKYLFDKGVDLKAENEWGQTIAHYYAYNKNATLECFEYLFEKEVDFKSENEWGRTIAHRYAKNQNATLEGFEYLFEKEVDFKTKDGDGNTIADVYIGKCKYMEKEPSKEILEFLNDPKLLEKKCKYIEKESSEEIVGYLGQGIFPVGMNEIPLKRQYTILITMQSGSISLDIDSSELCKVIKIARNTKDVTQKYIASKIGLTHQQIQKYESGQSRMTVEFLCQFLDILECQWVLKSK